MNTKRKLSLLLVLLTISFRVSAQDTLGVKEQKLEEVIISAQSAKRRVRNMQIGAEQLQMKELTKRFN